MNIDELTFSFLHTQVDAARRSVSRQYILITPNAIEGHAGLDKDVKIIRSVFRISQTSQSMRLHLNKTDFLS